MTEPRPRRRHAAEASRVAAAGGGVALMLGLVGAMAVGQHDSAEASTQPVALVAMSPAPVAPTIVAPPPAGSPAVPITLQPTVRVAPAPVAAAPVAATHGSK